MNSFRLYCPMPPQHATRQLSSTFSSSSLCSMLSHSARKDGHANSPFIFAQVCLDIDNALSSVLSGALSSSLSRHDHDAVSGAPHQGAPLRSPRHARWCGLDCRSTRHATRLAGKRLMQSPTGCACFVDRLRDSGMPSISTCEPSTYRSRLLTPHCHQNIIYS